MKAAIKQTLVGVLIITLLVTIILFFRGSASGSTPLSWHTARSLRELKTAVLAFEGTYGRRPSSISDLLEKSKLNSKKIRFLDGNKLPKDPYKRTSYLSKAIYNVKTVNFLPNSKSEISKYTIDSSAKGIIIYSVGENEKDDSGIHDSSTGKDDISVFIEDIGFSKNKSR